MPVQKWMWRKLRRLVPVVATLSLLLGGVAAFSITTARPAAADTGGYPDAGATTVNASLYEWGYKCGGSGQPGCIANWWDTIPGDPSGQKYNTLSPRGYAYRNCTDYVAWKLRDANGFTATSGLGNGWEWGGTARTRGYTVDMNPAKGSVAWYDKNAFGMSSYGHVAYVDSVNADGTVNLSEYNNPADGSYHTRLNVSASQVSGYIHFKDLASGGSGGGGTGGSVTGSRLSAVSFTSGQQMVFWKGGDGKLTAAYYSGSQWYTQSIGQANGFGQLYSPPAAVYQPSTGWIQVFWEGPGNTLYQAVLNNGVWVGGWQLTTAGSTVYSQPTAAVKGNEVDVFWKDNNGVLQEVVWNGSAWVPFTLDSSVCSPHLSSAPSAFDQASGEEDVFWADADGHLDECVWNGVRWVPFNLSAPGTVSSQPAADQEPNTGYQDVFWKDGDVIDEAVWNGALWVFFTPTTPTGPVPHTSGVATAPTSTAWGSQIDVFWTDSGGNLQEVVYNGAIWVNFTIPGTGAIPAS